MYPTIILRQKENYWEKVDHHFLTFMGTGHILKHAIQLYEKNGTEDGYVVHLHRYIFVW